MQDATMPSYCEQSDGKIISTEVLIIGFGFSAIPLIKELESAGTNYVIVSNGEGSIWDKLEKHGRLDFDLVSSMHTSLYSFELVNHDTKDRYLTAKEFLAFIRKYLTQYNSRLVKDWVTLVENYSSHSVVHTRAGRIFETKHLVISTAFQRRLNEQLIKFDYASATNKTIAFTAMGDSVNLMISKLIPFNNRIVLLTNGFFLLDKLAFYSGVSYTLDQYEYHNIRYLSHLLYRKTFWVGLEFVLLCQKLIKFLPIGHVYFKHPLAIRSFKRKLSLKYFAPHSPVPNGLIAIKYWPIDSYQKLFDGETLQQFITEGYLLNDIAFFLEQGLVELWPKQGTAIDREHRTIRWNDNLIRYDHIIDADYEVPNLPVIMVGKGVHRGKYDYVCRESFMGIVPQELSNIYLIGFIRPTTGGLNNITEMQCLFTHKMIVDPVFHNEIYENIAERIKRYNRYYYSSNEKKPTDNLVHYGFYTDDIARLLKINTRLADCRSLRDVMIHFIFPNNAFKFRQTGSYKVEGVQEMVQQIYKDHKGFWAARVYLLNYALLQLTSYVAVIMAFYQHFIDAVAVPLLLAIVMFNPITPFIAGWSTSYSLLNTLIIIIALGLTAISKDVLIPIATLLVAFAVTYAFHKLGWSRAPFNDLTNKNRQKYQTFFKRYCEIFKEVFSERYRQGGQHYSELRSDRRASDPAQPTARLP